MKFHRFGIPAVAFAFAATAAVAQNPAPAPAPDSAKAPAAATPATAPAAAPAADTTQSFVARRLAIALNGIDLSADQRTRLDIVKERVATRLAGIVSDSALTAEQRRTLGEHDAEIRSVLSAEQQIVWDRNVSAMRNSVSRSPR